MSSFPWRRWRLILGHLTLAMVCIIMVLTSRCIVGKGTTGDFPLFLDAAHHLIAGEPLHAPGRGYIYGPFAAMLFVPLLPLGPAGAAWALGILNATAYWICLILGSRGSLRLYGARYDALVLMEVALIAMLLSMDKARLVISGGQTDFLVALPLVIGVLWGRHRPVAAGAALGFAASIKYIAVVFLPYLILRRRWRQCGAMGASMLCTWLAPALICGWNANAEYWRIALAGMGRLLGLTPSSESAPVGEVTFEFSISITSALARLLDGTLTDRGILAVVAAVALGTAAIAAGLYTLARVPLWRRAADFPSEPVVSLVEQAGLVVAVLAFSPQTQGRHFLMLLPMYLQAAVMLRRPRASRGLLLLGLVTLQAGLILPPGGMRSTEHAVQAWRSIGGASWCLLFAFLCFLWTGLRTASAGLRAPEELLEVADRQPD